MGASVDPTAPVTHVTANEINLKKELGLVFAWFVNQESMKN